MLDTASEVWACRSNEKNKHVNGIKPKKRSAGGRTALVFRHDNCDNSLDDNGVVYTIKQLKKGRAPPRGTGDTTINSSLFVANERYENISDTWYRTYFSYPVFNRYKYTGAQNPPPLCHKQWGGHHGRGGLPCRHEVRDPPPLPQVRGPASLVTRTGTSHLGTRWGTPRL